MLGLRGAMDFSYPLDMGVFPKGESMALVQAVANWPMKPYVFHLQSMSFSLDFQTHMFSPCWTPLPHPISPLVFHAQMFVLL